MHFSTLWRHILGLVYPSKQVGGGYWFWIFINMFYCVSVSFMGISLVLQASFLSVLQGSFVSWFYMQIAVITAIRAGGGLVSKTFSSLLLKIKQFFCSIKLLFLINLLICKLCNAFYPENPPGLRNIWFLITFYFPIWFWQHLCIA